MAKEKIVIDNTTTKITAIIIGIIYLFLLTANIYDNIYNFADVDIFKVGFPLILVLTAIYIFINRKIKILLNEEVLEIKWKGTFKVYRFKVEDINIIKFNSSRIIIETIEKNKTFDISFLKDKDKLKLKRFLLNNFESKYSLG